MNCTKLYLKDIINQCSNTVVHKLTRNSNRSAELQEQKDVFFFKSP